MYDKLCHDPNVAAIFVEDTQPPGSEDYGQLELEVNSSFEKAGYVIISIVYTENTG